MAMVSMAKDVGIDAMPKHLRIAASTLQERLQELITTGAGEATGPLKRILDRASLLLVVPGDDHASSSRRGGLERAAVEPAVEPAVEGSEICRHTCEYHEELMHPSIWGNLRNASNVEVLYQIFARLPLSKINSLQVLSREWRGEMRVYRDDDGNLVESNFLKVCEEVHPKVGLITRDKENKFWVRLLDVKSNQWRAFQISAGHSNAVDITAASEDGGLVCFVSTIKQTKQSKRTFIVDVVNPLTKDSTALPPLDNLSIVQMAQIVVEPETKNYTVLVVGDEAGTGALVAKLYDRSVPDAQWRPPKRKKKSQSNFTFGYAYHWGNLRYSHKRDTPCVFDVAGKELHLLKDFPLERDEGPSPLNTPSVKSLAQQGDRVFVLQRDKFGPISFSGYNRGSPAYYIVEYRVQMRPKREWVKIKAHSCKPFENPPKAKYDLSLFACKGFLMVLARLPEDEPYRNEVGWSYNLTTCKWSDLPKLPGEKPYDVHDMMCSLRWNSSL